MHMHSQRVPGSVQQLVLLSQQFEVDLDDVTWLYRRELDRLGVDAKVQQYLTIFALRHVRAVLLARAEARSIHGARAASEASEATQQALRTMRMPAPAERGPAAPGVPATASAWRSARPAAAGQ